MVGDMNKERSKNIYKGLLSKFLTKRGNFKFSTKKRNKIINRYSFNEDKDLVFAFEFFDAADISDIERSFSLSEMKMRTFLLPDTKLKIKTHEGVIFILPWKEAKKLTFRDLSAKPYSRDDLFFCSVTYNEDRITEEMVEKTCKKLVNYSVSVFKKYAKTLNKNNVYIVEAKEWNYVVHDFKAVACGAWHDFHAGCFGLNVYKGNKLGDWCGANNLANIIANYVNGDVVKIIPKKEDKRFLDLLFVF